MPDELNEDQKLGLAERNEVLRAYAVENGFEDLLDEEMLNDHSLSLGTAKAKLRGKAERAGVQPRKKASQ